MDKMLDKVNQYLEKVNRELKDGKIGFRVERRGRKLYLRGTVPTKEGNKSKRIPLGLGYTIENIKLAKLEAIKLYTQIQNGTYGEKEIYTIGEAIQSLEEDYFSRRARTKQTESTWYTMYLSPFRKLPHDKILTPEIIRETILSTPPDTKVRQYTCLALQALAKHCGIEFDTTPYKGSYGPSYTRPRVIPSDEEIIASIDLFKNDRWKILMLLLAAYGLRPHEVYYLDRSELPKLRVLDGKTGGRIVYPVPAHWIDIMDLTGELPPITGKYNTVLGQKIGKQFREYKVPYTPYALRHAYAIRSIIMGIPINLSSAWMGHSVVVHNRTYEKWITEQSHAQGFELYVKRQVSLPQPYPLE